ncbi:hypothetical protein C8R43DRAFT_962592 [Mycena crocata]|nr:hypothetical protein C8R43DRAFT_962592 [Mycena crocata]
MLQPTSSPHPNYCGSLDAPAVSQVPSGIWKSVARQFPEPHALRICTAAARACIGYVDIYAHKSLENPLFSPHLVFTAAMIVIVRMSIATQPHSRSNPMHHRQDLRHVHTALEVLRPQQTRCPAASFFMCASPLRTVLERLLSMASDADASISRPNANVNPYAGTVAKGIGGIEFGVERNGHEDSKFETNEGTNTRSSNPGPTRPPEPWVLLAPAWMASAGAPLSTEHIPRVSWFG